MPGMNVGASRSWHSTKYCKVESTDLTKIYMWDTDDTFFSYNAHALHSFGWWRPLFTCVMSRIFSRQLHLQGFLFVAFALLLGYILCLVEAIHAPGCEMDNWKCNEGGPLTRVLEIFESDIASLARYVGGLFLSLALAKTYYSNRGLLGTVFAQTLGLSMAASSWIKPRGCPIPEDELRQGSAMDDIMPRNFKELSPQELHDHLKNLGELPQETLDALLANDIGGGCFFDLAKDNVGTLGLGSFRLECALLRYMNKMLHYHEWMISAPEVIDIRKEIIRYSNAGFRMLWLEHIGDDQLVDVEEGNYDILAGLLTPEEWKHIDGIPSRVTYVYSWICDLIWQAREKGFVRSDMQVVRMHEYVEILRGANVWGLPSLPFPYVYWITVLVKSTILLTVFVAARNMGHLLYEMDMDKVNAERVIAMVMICMNVLFVNFVWQGLLDLHSMLRNPNQGLLAGHMPTEIFLSFTKKVTENVNQLLPRAPINNMGQSTRFDKDGGRMNSLSRADLLLELVLDVADKSGGVNNSFAGNIAFMETAHTLGFKQEDVRQALFKVNSRRNTMTANEMELDDMGIEMPKIDEFDEVKNKNT